MRTLLVLILPAVFLLLGGAANAAPRISEFMADNTDTLRDEDGDYSDWVEIHNPDPAAVDLTGYALTDDALLPQKWVLPSISIPSGGYLIVFASAKNRANPAAELHTNFALNNAGEYLALVAPDGTTKLTEFAPMFPFQEMDKSYGNGLPGLNYSPILPGAPCRWLVPTSTVANWNAPGFSDAAWNAGNTGVGYENVPTSINNYVALISPNANTLSQMYNISGRTTCYIRIPFNVTDAAAVDSMTLKMKYDDGYVTFLNGTQVASANPPATALAFNSAAGAGHADSLAVVYENKDLSSFKNLLITGTNTLAIQGLNDGANSSDFLVLPELEIVNSAGATPLVTGYFNVPTPGTGNGVPVDGFVKDTKFSVNRGFFTTSFSLAITTTTPGAEIRYTTNGSAPTATTGTVYSGPINITTTTVIRAAAFRANWQPSNVDTQTYIFAAAVRNQASTQAGFPTTWGHTYNFSTGLLNNTPQTLVPADYAMDPAVANAASYTNIMTTALQNSLPVLSIVADTNDVFGPSGIYSDGRMNADGSFPTGRELPASVEFFGNGSGDGFNLRCGLRIHGGDALIEHPKKPFRLYFRKEYGAGKLDFPLFPNSPVRKFDRLQLRGGGHDGWAVPFGGTSFDLGFHATYVRDEFLRQTEHAQGRLAPHGRFAHLYINGLYWGFYDIHEVPSNDYFKSHVGGEADDWDVVEQPSTAAPYDIVDGTGDEFEILMALCTPATRPADPLIYEQIERYLDMDEYIDHMIVMIWAGQNDWVGPVFRGATNLSRFFNKNWNAGRLSRGPLYTSFLFSAWDAEISMGTQLVSATLGHRISDFDHSRVGELGFGGTPGPPGLIYNALRSNDQFRRKFADRLHKNFFNAGPMTTAKNQARLLALRNSLILAIVPESARWGDVNASTLGGTPDFTRNDHWIPEMDWMNLTFLASRNATVLSQFQARGLYSTILPPTYSTFGGLVMNGFQLTMTNPNGTGTIFYTLDGSDPFLAAGPVQTKLVTAASPSKYWIPDSAVLGDTWKDVADPANIGIWSDGTSAIGADTFTTYPPYTTTTVPAMIAGSTSMYIRIPFTIASQAQLDSITALALRLRYDDGARVYLNGVGPITSLNAPATPPAFNDSASAQNVDTAAVVLQTIDWTAQIPNLVVGTNYLCIHGLNVTGSSDYLISPELVATTGTIAEGPSPTAIAYTGPVPLTQSGPVLARVRTTTNTWSPLTEATFVVGTAATAANLVLSELNYNPSAPTLAEDPTNSFGDSDFEYIELHNPTLSTVELTGLRFIAGIDFDFINSSIASIPPGGRILIVKNAAAFAARHGAGLPVAGEFASDTGLSNTGERLALLSATSSTIFDFTYNNNAPWPNPPSGSGLSLVLIRPETFPNHSLPANWRLSGYPNGGPNTDDRTTFTAWLAANGGVGTETSDTDEDGIWNLTEYFLSSLLNASSTTALPVAGIRQYTPGGIAGNYLTLTFRRLIGPEDIAYFVEFGTAPATLNQPGVLANSTYNLDGTVTETWRSATPITSTVAQFGRVRIVK